MRSFDRAAPNCGFTTRNRQLISIGEPFLSVSELILLLKKIDGLRVCTIAAGPERGIQREHASSERIVYVPARWCSRNTKKPHAQSVYLFKKDCMCVGITAPHCSTIAKIKGKFWVSEGSDGDETWRTVLFRNTAHDTPTDQVLNRNHCC
ncbi:hypothetical protein Y032_0030g2191 [Ancylostoma ceylanicum]|nr:hypothetical protein Y032_0030g2191 [Ancylostoma ceylanicum]